jgi:hypothetical protein
VCVKEMFNKEKERGKKKRKKENNVRNKPFKEDS